MAPRRTWSPPVSAAALALALFGASAVAIAGAQQADVPPPLPLGLPPIIWPPDNPYSKVKAELGRALYYDKRLSSDNSVSCASCHDPRFGFTDGQKVATGIRGQKGSRSAPTVINRAYSGKQFWDGRARTLEDQVKGPLANALEMTAHENAEAAHKACVASLKGIPGYVRLFNQAFGTEEFDIDHVAKAIATFERTIVSGNAPFDRYQAGDRGALSGAQVRGMEVFFKKAACDSCHFGVNFSDSQFANVGIGMDKPNPDPGRFGVTKRPEDIGAFKTPSLREVARTAPYFHDGSVATLAEVVEHYAKGGIKNPTLDQRMKPLKLSTQEKADLVEFQKALNGEGWQHASPPANLPQ